jgi:DNA-binding transcriptional LysR family regulator
LLEGPTVSRDALTPEALAMVDAIAVSGSFAGAARQLGKVPSALTYGVRQLEESLDVLLFDRSSRQARLTAAGQELLEEGRRLLAQMDAVANRVKRVATGWETTLAIAYDEAVCRPTLLDLCADFYAGRDTDGEAPPPTRLVVRPEVLAGTWEAVLLGRADLAIGVGADREPPADIGLAELGELPFVFVVARGHPLADAAEPLGDAELLRHRAIAIADSATRLTPLTVHLLPGQEVLTVGDLQTKVEALLRGIGVGFLPAPAAAPCIADGRLVAKRVARAEGMPPARLAYAWRQPLREGRPQPPGRALAWWLARLAHGTTRRAMLA